MQGKSRFDNENTPSIHQLRVEFSAGFSSVGLWDSAQYKENQVSGLLTGLFRKKGGN